MCKEYMAVNPQLSSYTQFMQFQDCLETQYADVLEYTILKYGNIPSSLLPKFIINLEQYLTPFPTS